MRNNQIILGSGGAIGTLLAKELVQFTNNIHLYSRNPKKVNGSDHLISGDLLDESQLNYSLQKMNVAYLVAGLEYKDSVWERDWLKIVENVVNACKRNKVSLVFFDNVYMYDPSCFGNLTEETPVKPVSRKGKVRAKIDALLRAEMENDSINVQIVRSADFYGKGTTQSMLNQVVIEKLLSGKTASWFINSDKKHSFTLIDDAAKATALLGNTNSAYNQIWHLPTDKAYTLNEIVQKISLYSDKPVKIRVASNFMIKIFGLFVPVIRESKQLLYQYENDYVFNSSKFEKAFNRKPTSMADGLKNFILKN